MSESQHAQYALIVAGGSGTRMGSKIPKQFLEMTGRPVLIHTLEAFHKCSSTIKIILVLPEAHMGLWQEMVERYQFSIPVVLQSGGETRFQSVKKGLEKVKGEGLVAIHDGVRPVIDAKLIQTSFRIAGQHQSAIATVDLKDSLRKIEGSHSKWLDRTQYQLVQTPQTFDIKMIKEAYQIPEQSTFTDDASVWEAAGHQVTLFKGSHENIKITTFHDLVLAEVLLKFL